ncbi:HTH domain-containing protein [Streptococcus sp. DD13]|uniref:HTH domain-containing protein n=1 Tax=Streptococcus sp. DD13 TaxID=1777881 RepID=UPI00079A478B|nr:HTH domain-containing protein [Streptococcus sp. DD13]KXT77478.1 Sorbitol operon transcription regulator [Streptococcus sp. DD13]
MSLELHKKELLYVLSSEPSVSYVIIEEKLNISKRSIKLLVESLLYSYGHIFSIQEKGESLSLTIYDQESFKLLVMEELLQSSDLNSFHKRQAVFFRRLLDANGFLSADDLAEEMGISRRSLTRDMARMKELLTSYDLLLISKPGVGICLEGSELNKRLLYLYEVVGYLEQAIELPEEVIDTYTDFIASKHFPLEVQKSFLSTLQLTWKRRHYPLERSDFHWFTRQTELDLPTIVYEVFDFYWGRPITEEEKYFLTFPMQLGLIAADVERQDVLSVVQSALALTIKEYGIQLDIEEDALLLQRHLIYLLNRSVMKWELTEVSLREQLLQSSFSHVVADFFLRCFSDKLQITISKKEVPLFAAWMELLLARKSKPLIGKIAVVSQAGQSFNVLVEQQILQIFGNDCQITFLEFTNHAPYEELEAKYDLVFTDNLMYSEELFKSCISLTIVTRENTKERVRMEQTVLARKIQLYCQVISTQFEAGESYEANLSALLGRLADGGFIDHRHIQDILAKEEKRPAVSSNGFAYPHLTSETLQQLTIVVLEEECLGLKHLNGLSVEDFILLLVPTKLDEFQQDVLYKIFDNIFRTEQGCVKERLGIPYMTELLHV